MILTHLCLQHVLIFVKMVLRVLIPDEPHWIRKKREHIEYRSMQALKQQVNPHVFHNSSFWLLSLIGMTASCISLLTDAAFLIAFTVLGWCFMLSCDKLLQPEDRVPTSVLCRPRYESSLGYPADSVHSYAPSAAPPTHTHTHTFEVFVLHPSK